MNTIWNILYQGALREIVKATRTATNTIARIPVSEVCIVKASISHRTWFCRCQSSLVGSQRRWWKDAYRRRDGGRRRKRRERKDERQTGREKSLSLSLPLSTACYRSSKHLSLHLDGILLMLLLVPPSLRSLSSLPFVSCLQWVSFPTDFTEKLDGKSLLEMDLQLNFQFTFFVQNYSFTLFKSLKRNTTVY